MTDPHGGLPTATVMDVSLDDAWLLVAAVLLTLFDGAATYAWIEAGIAAEGNPLIRWLMAATDTATALGLRVVVGCALLVGLYGLVRRTTTARTALVTATATLGVVGLWHLQGFAILAAG